MARKKKKDKSKAKAKKFFRERAKSEAELNRLYTKSRKDARKGIVPPIVPLSELLTVEESEESDDGSDD